MLRAARMPRRSTINAVDERPDGDDQRGHAAVPPARAEPGPPGGSGLRRLQLRDHAVRGGVGDHAVRVEDRRLGGARQAAPCLLDWLKAGEPAAPAMPKDPELSGIIARAMAHDAANRFTADELVRALKQYLTGDLVFSHRYSVLGRMSRWARRHKAATVGIASLVAFAIAGTLVYGYLSQKAKEEAELRAMTAAAQADASQKERVADDATREARRRRRSPIRHSARARMRISCGARPSRSARPPRRCAGRRCRGTRREGPGGRRHEALPGGNEAERGGRESQVPRDRRPRAREHGADRGRAPARCRADGGRSSPRRERETARLAREAAEREREAAKQAAVAAEQDRDAARSGQTRAEQDREAARRAQEAAERERDAATAARETVERERDEARRRLAELEQRLRDRERERSPEPPPPAPGP